MDKCVSVIIPVYNPGKYLNACVESVINQSYKELEIILVDDGSTDGSSEVCDQYAQEDSRIRVIHQNNQGLPNARNKGLDVAKGEFIGFVDSDDQISPIMYEALVEICEKENADIASTRSTIALRTLYKKNIEEINYKVSDQPLFTYLETEGHSVWRRIYKRELFEKVRFEDINHGEDVIFSYDLYNLCKRSVCLEVPLYYWNQENTSMSRGKVKSLNNPSETIYQRAKEFRSDVASVAKIRSIQTEYRLLTRTIKYGLATEKLKDEFLTKYKDYLEDIRHNMGDIIKSPLFGKKDIIQLCALACNRFDKKYCLNRFLTREHEHMTWKFQVLLRKEEYWEKKKNAILSLYYRRKKNKLGERLGFTIPKNTFGPGLRIWHYGNIVVNAYARVGENCNLHGDNCIGNKGLSGGGAQL